MKHTIDLTLNTFETTLKNNKIVLLDFWASWCGPCRMFAPIFEKVASQHTDVVFGKVDTEAEEQLAGMFQIRSIPTLMAFREGVLLFSQAGVLPEAALEDLISQIKALDMNVVRAEIEAQKKKTATLA